MSAPHSSTASPSFGPNVGLESSASSSGSERQIQALKAELKELQLKYDNQRQLLDHATGATSTLPSSGVSVGGVVVDAPRSSLGIESSSVGTSLTSSTASSSDYLKLQQSCHILQSQVQSLQSALASQTEELDTIKNERIALQHTIRAKDVAYDQLTQTLQSSRSEVERAQKESASSNTLVEKLSETITTYEHNLEVSSTRLLSMDAEFKHLKTLQQEKFELEGLVEKLRNLLLTTTKDSSKKNQDLLNMIQTTRQFLEELKREYEAYAQQTKLEHDLYRRSKGKELQELQQRYDLLKLTNYETSQELHREQVDIIDHLQTHFMEYRLMVENLFYTEARSLETKLSEQQMKYEKEMKYVMRLKDQHFHEMITSKDAKIMNLIEGTDFSRILIQHQMELESLKKKHETDLELCKDQVSSDNKKLILSLKKDLMDKSVEIDKYHTQILTWEKKLEQTLGLLKKQKKLHTMKEESSEKHAKEVQTQLQKAYGQIETLIQVKENLRHRILRLRLQIDGTADDSIPSIIKRLTKETKRLSTDLSMLTFNYRLKLESQEELQRVHTKSLSKIEQLEKELSQRTKEYTLLTKTYESFLSHRLKGGVLGSTGQLGGRVSLYDPAVTKVLEQVSGPFLQALFQHKSEGMAKGGGQGTMRETLIRAAAATNHQQAQQQATMVGLRIGPDQAQFHDEKDSLRVSSVLSENPASTKRRSVVIDVATAGGGRHASINEQHQQQQQQQQQGGGNMFAHAFSNANATATTNVLSVHPLSARSSADLESAPIIGGSARSSRRPSAHATMQNPYDPNEMILPTPTQLSTRNSPLPQEQQMQHGRHVSITNKFRSSTNPTPVPDVDGSSPGVDSWSHPPPVPSASVAGGMIVDSHRARGSFSSLHSNDSHRPVSRSSRLHDLMKTTSNLNLSNEVRRIPEPKSLREKERRQQAEMTRIIDQQQQSPHSNADGSVDGGSVVLPVKSKKKKSSSRTHKYTKPSSLIELESQSELLDLDSIRQLERGYTLLERFKANSIKFQQDAKGRIKRDQNDADGGETKQTTGLGAFQRNTKQTTTTTTAATNDEDENQIGDTESSNNQANTIGSVNNSYIPPSTSSHLDPPLDDASVSVHSLVTRIYGSTSDSYDSRRSSQNPFDYGQFNSQQFGETDQQIEQMGNMHTQEGEPTRLYNPSAPSSLVAPSSASSSSVIPWWSSAASTASIPTMTQPLNGIAAAAAAGAPTPILPTYTYNPIANAMHTKASTSASAVNKRP